MIRFIIKRLFLFIPVLIGVTFIVFTIDALSPGDPAAIILGNAASPEALEQLHEEMGLDDPLVIRYGNYMKNACTGDLGKSYKTKLPISAQVKEKVPNTVILAVAGMIIAVIIGIPSGVLCAKHADSIFDRILMFFTLLFISAPAFWVGLLLIICFSLNLKWFPSSGMGDGFIGSLRSLVLPGMTTGLSSAAVICRMTRSSMLEVIQQDFISLARAKGVKESKVTTRHMLKNALIPVVTVIGLQFGVLLGGAVMTETVFAWPGWGRCVVDAIKSRDSPAILGAVIVMTIMVALVNLIVDILYAYIDPRIKAQYEQAVQKKNVRKKV